jgi:hypothetical protein
VLVVLGSFLPWLSVGPFSASAWDLSVGGVITGHNLAGGLKVGLVLLAVLAVGVPALTKRPLPDAVVPVIGLVAAGLAVVTLVRGLNGDRTEDIHITYDPGIGLFLALAGGLIMAIDLLRRLGNRTR